MTSSRCQRIAARAAITTLLTFPGFNAHAEDGTTLFQYEMGFGGNRPTSTFYYASQLQLVTNALESGDEGWIRIPLYSTKRRAWTLYRALRPMRTALALEGSDDLPAGDAPASEDEAAQDSSLGTFGRVLLAGGALGVLVYMSSKEEKRECTSGERSACIVGGFLGGGGCDCKL